MLRRRRTASVVVPEPQWAQRAITLVGNRGEVDRICAEWQQEGWQVLTVDAAVPTADGSPTHLVRVAVPPVGWRTREQLLDELES
ncbi:MAG: hypothetical protein JWO22_958 [Frankiales bacterium]|nr:hypothetical protein [Frankiales bacterium]